MQGPVRAYLSGASAALTSRGLSVVAGMLSLWLLARILETDDFAGYVAAMSVVLLLGHAGGFGIERSMLLRIGSAPGSRLAGGGMALRCGVLVAALSLVVALAARTLSSGIPALSEGLTDDWIARLWPLIPGQALLLVLVHWYLANHWMGLSQVVPGVQDAARSLFFAAVFALGLGAGFVAAGAVLASLVPIALLLAVAAGRGERQPDRLEVRDLRAGLQFLVMRVATMGLRQIDIIVLGFAVGGTETAIYAIASRIGDIAQVGRQAFVQTYAPRSRHHHLAGDRDAVVREYEATQSLSLLLTLGVSLVAVLAGVPALGLFGDFESGYPVLLLVLAGHVLTASFGAHDIHLSMIDRLGAATLNRLVTLGLFVGLLLVLVPRHGGLGAAVAFILASAFYGTAGVILMRTKNAEPPVGASAVAAGALTTTALSGVALVGIAPAYAAAAILGSAALVAFRALRPR